MPTKVGNGGYGQENYDDKTGKYTDSEQSKAMEAYGLKKEKDWDSRSALPKTTSQLIPRTFFHEKDEQEQEKIEQDYYKIFGEKLDNIDKKAEIPTITDNSVERMNFRTQAVQEEIEKQKNERNINNNFKATIVLGLPGSGKSTITNKLLIEDGAYEIDADNMKKRIPEFKQDSENVSKVHNESVMMSETMLNNVMNQGSNVVIGKVGGGNGRSLVNLVKNLSSNGYQIEVVFNDLPMEIAIQRAATRFLKGETTRVIPFDIFTTADGKINKNYDMLMNMPEIRRGRIFSNDVPHGSELQLLREDVKENGR